MKVRLLFTDRDPDVRSRVPARADDLIRDLGIEALLEVMAAGDERVRDQLAPTLLSPLDDVAEIAYRQDVLLDFLALPGLAEALHRLAAHAVDSPRRTRTWLFGKDPSSVMRRSRDILADLLSDLHELRTLADDHADRCRSAGLTAMFATVRTELPDDYFPLVEGHLQRLQFSSGVVMTAAIGPSGQGTGYVLRKPHSTKRTWRQLVGLGDPDSYTYRLPDRDEAGARAMMALESIGINLVADALAQSVDHIRSFFAQLQFETAFYRGCVELSSQLSERELPNCRPDPRPAEELALSAHGLYEVNLGLHLGGRVITNDLAADGASLVMITGPNQGGKSTMLRAIGLAQLLMQAGCLVAARGYRASVASGLFTHYRREEDVTMTSGKLDEELARMSDIVDRLTPGALVLLNESFAATNEREGSAIGRHVVDGLRAGGVRVAYVTHLYGLADGLYRDSGRSERRSIDEQPAERLSNETVPEGQPGPVLGGAVFLRPERLHDTARTFRVLPGAPRPTSYGPDLYHRIFGEPADTVAKGG